MTWRTRWLFLRKKEFFLRKQRFSSLRIVFFRSRSGRAQVPEALVFDDASSQSPRTDDQFAQLHRRLWSWGAVPLVYRRLPGRVDIFRCGQNPISIPGTNSRNTHSRFDQTAGASLSYWKKSRGGTCGDWRMELYGMTRSSPGSFFPKILPTRRSCGMLSHWTRGWPLKAGLRETCAVDCSSSRYSSRTLEDRDVLQP